MCCDWCSASRLLCLFCGIQCFSNVSFHYPDYAMRRLAEVLKPRSVLERGGLKLWLKPSGSGPDRILFVTGQRMFSRTSALRQKLEVFPRRVKRPE
jgi:hypothetical protein